MATADFTIADVLAWARTKPATQRYDYVNFNECALAQYSRHIGVSIFSRARIDAENGDLGDAAQDGERTFGAFVERLERLLPAEPIGDTWTKPDAYLTDIEQVEA
jgi:hypothetical protein